MRRLVAQLTVVLLLALLVCAPIFEHFDRWDGFPRSGHDIVLTLVGVVVCFAAGISLVRTVVQALPGMTSWLDVAPAQLAHCSPGLGRSDTELLISPHLSLRI